MESSIHSIFSIWRIYYLYDGMQLVLGIVHDVKLINNSSS